MAMQVYLRLSKVDASQRLVYGVCTEEAVDRSREIMDYASSKPNFEAWSNSMYKASGGKSYGNLRAMHKTVAAGLFSEPFTFDDEGRLIAGVARVVDDAEWAKVESGVYTGFSVGGEYGKRWQDPDNPQFTRYTALPSEISLVDLPCAKGATFQFIKGEGMAPEEREFTSVMDSNVQADPPEKPAEPADPSALGKGADKPQAESSSAAQQAATSPAPLTKDTASEVEVEQVWKAKDGSTFAKKADAVSHNMRLATKEAVAAAANPALDALGKLGTLMGVEPEDSAVQVADPAASAPAAADPEARIEKTAEPFGYKLRKRVNGSVKAESLKKGMYDIGRLASLVSEMNWLADGMRCEEAVEQDGSTLSANAQSIIDAMCTLLRAMVVEETSELMSDTDDSDNDSSSDVIVILAAAASMNPELRKNAASVKEMPARLVQLLQKADSSECPSGGNCDICQNCPTCQAGMDKAAAGGSLLKSFEALTEADLKSTNEKLPAGLQLVLAKGEGLEIELGRITLMVGKLTKKYEELAAQPMPAKGSLRALTKAEDTALSQGRNPAPNLDKPEDIVAAYNAHLAKLSPEARSMELMKMALANPTLRLE